MVVQANGLVLYVVLGSGYYPIACTRDVTISTETEMIETAPKENGIWRAYAPGRITGTISGNGLVNIQPGAGYYSALNVWDYQFSQETVLVKADISDGTDTYIYECQCLVQSVQLTGSAANPMGFSYTLQMKTELEATTIPVSSDATIDVYDYTESLGGTTTISSGDLIGANVLLVDRNGIGVEVITSGTPTTDQVKFTTGTGSLEFGYALGVGEWIHVIYAG
jgi:hypothetical protein